MRELSAFAWGCALALASSQAPGAAAVKDAQVHQKHCCL